MIKKLILVFIASVFIMTGCQSINSVDLNQMVLNNSKIKSSESKMTASLQLAYNKADVKDKDLQKVLDLLNHMKVELQTKMQNSNTVSLSGNIILQKGKIPVKLYIDKKEMVVLLDNASKPIRISVDSGASKNDELVQDVQAKLIAPIVENLPNPKHISVKAATEKVHGTDVNGFEVHAEVNASEVPDLLLTFIDNLLKDENNIAKIVDAVNELNKMTGDNTKTTSAEIKSGLELFKTELTQSLPELKKTEYLSTKNNFKTDILVDSKFFERKTSSVFYLASLPKEIGLKSIRLQIDNENWNINKTVKAQKNQVFQELKGRCI